MTTQEAPVQLHSIADSARMLGVSPLTVRRLIDEHEIASVNVGARRLISTEELERIKEEGAGKPRKGL